MHSDRLNKQGNKLAEQPDGQVLAGGPKALLCVGVQVTLRSPLQQLVLRL
jgi:hypothetical protein